MGRGWCKLKTAHEETEPSGEYCSTFGFVNKMCFCLFLVSKHLCQGLHCASCEHSQKPKQETDFDPFKAQMLSSGEITVVRRSWNLIHLEIMYIIYISPVLVFWVFSESVIIIIL